MKRILILLAIVFMFGFAVIATVISYASRDIPEPDVADLAVERPDIPPADNAYTYFISATNALYWPTNSAERSRSALAGVLDAMTGFL